MSEEFDTTAPGQEPTASESPDETPAVSESPRKKTVDVDRIVQHRLARERKRFEAELSGYKARAEEADSLRERLDEALGREAVLIGKQRDAAISGVLSELHVLEDAIPLVLGHVGSKLDFDIETGKLTTCDGVDAKSWVQRFLQDHAFLCKDTVGSGAGGKPTMPNRADPGKKSVPSPIQGFDVPTASESELRDAYRRLRNG